MAHIVGFTGAHGVGKSTLLGAIAHQAAQGIYVDQYSVSRNVQKDFYPDQDLSAITKVSANVPVFQEHIVDRMYQRVRDLEKVAAQWVLVDRTAIDCYAYARLWTDQHPEHKAWLAHYKIRCARAMLAYGFVFVIPPRDFAFEHQQDRASKQTQAQHHEYIKDFLREFARPFKVVRVKTVSSRTQYCLSTLQNLNLT